jgi:hypothetical protein
MPPKKLRRTSANDAMKKETLLDELRDLSEHLHADKQAGANAGFRVPDGYFDTLEDAVFRRLDANGERRAAPLNAQHGGRRRWLAAAAALALALTAAWWLWLRPAPEAAILAAAAKPNLSADDAASYLLDNLHELDAEQIAALAPAEIPVEAPPAAERPTEPDVSPDAIEDLLLDMSDEELENLLL